MSNTPKDVLPADAAPTDSADEGTNAPSDPSVATSSSCVGPDFERWNAGGLAGFEPECDPNDDVSSDVADAADVTEAAPDVLWRSFLDPFV